MVEGIEVMSGAVVQICERCLMDTSDSDIVFDSMGIRNRKLPPI